MNTNEEQGSDTLHKQMKKVVITLAILIAITLSILIGALVIKHSKKTSSKNLIQESVHQVLDYKFNKKCYPVETTVKEKYIIMKSRKCHIIKIVALKDGKVIQIINY